MKYITSLVAFFVLIGTNSAFSQAVSFTVDQKDPGNHSDGNIFDLESNNLTSYSAPHLFTTYSVGNSANFDADHRILTDTWYSLMKYHDWDFESARTKNVVTPTPTITISSGQSNLKSNLEVSNYAILQNEFVDGLAPLLGGGQIGFKDPWFKGDATFTDNASTPKNLGYSANYDYVSSTANSGSSKFSTFPGEAGSGNVNLYHNGVFLSQGTPSNWSTSPPYYSISPQPVMSGSQYSLFGSEPPTYVPAIGDLMLTGFDLTNGTNADLYYYTSTGSDTAAIFTGNNATVYPQYKAHLATSNDGFTTATSVNSQAPGLPSNSQRAIVYCEPYHDAASYGLNDEFGGPFYAMIYIEHGMLYFSYSASDSWEDVAPGVIWSQDIRIDQSSSSGSPTGFVQNASICIRSDGHVGIVYADSNPAHVAYGISSTEPIISLLEGTPVASGSDLQVTSFTWNFNSSLNNTDGSVILYSDNEAYTIQGKKPVIAPRILSTDPSGYPDSHSSFTITNSGYWITWVVDQSITGYLTNPGVYTAVASKSCSGAFCFATPNPYCVLPPRTALGGVVGNNPSVSASFIDEPNFLNKTCTNSSEGDSLHVSWDYGNKIEYNTVKSTNAAGSSLQCTFTKTEEPSTYTSATNLVAPNYQWTFNSTIVSQVFTNSRPSLAVDNYKAANGNVYEEPVVAWQT